MFCIWITGLPGSGKSTIARNVKKSLADMGREILILQLDEIRKYITPEPRYTDEERDVVYRSLGYMAKLLVSTDCKDVIIDATGNRRTYRDTARALILEFAEVYIQCPLEVCQEREASRVDGLVEGNLYQKAREGRLKGGVPGITAAYEESENPEVVIHSDVLSPVESAEEIVSYVRSRWLR